MTFRPAHQQGVRRPVVALVRALQGIVVGSLGSVIQALGALETDHDAQLDDVLGQDRGVGIVREPRLRGAAR